MAVPVQQHAALEPGRLEIGRVPFEKLAQQEGLLPQLLGAGVGREEAAQLVAEHRRTARLEHDEGNRVDVRRQMIHDALQIRLRAIEHPEIVKGRPQQRRADGTVTCTPADLNTSSAARLVSGWK